MQINMYAFKTIQWVNIVSGCICGGYLLQTFAMPPQPQMQIAFTAQYTGKSVCQPVQRCGVNYTRSSHWLHWGNQLGTDNILLI